MYQDRASILTQSDYDDLLVYLYFGPERDFLLSCIGRAYYSFCRTLHGIARIDNERAMEIWEAARHGLKEQFAQASTINDQDEFDHWHRSACMLLHGTYSRNGYERFHVGQAQKWINMAFKFVYAMGERRVPDFDAIYRYCHVPIDNVVLDRLETGSYNIPRAPFFPCHWSRIDDYGQYLEFQSWLRQRFTVPPLDVEFLLWMGKGVPAEYLNDAAGGNGC